MLAKNEVEMNQMLRKLKKYLEEVDMELSVKKSKMMIFGEARGRKIRNATHWWWDNEELEEVKEFNYLGYLFSKKNTAEAHILKRIRKSNALLGELWSKGQRFCRNSWKLRMRMFNAIARSVLLYGAELYGWEDNKRLNTVQIKYIKSILELEKQTPAAFTRAETEIQKNTEDAILRAANYEDKCAESEMEFRRIIYSKGTQKQGKR